ncbi:MAG: hypothetical protein H0W88_10600 [Parachlamydiaceae bacterium]|nr:hypothetical protein [Parachlamydiaceae bacterium]
MATKKEIKQHLKIALEEVGGIEPWFDEMVNSWIFEHPSYPVGCDGSSRDEVIKKYPLYLEEFINERLNNNISPSVEVRIKGKGGKREGAGRPVNPNKEAKVRVYLPLDIANLLKEPGVLTYLRGLIHACHHAHL